ncbi:BTB/POZ domain-containing protein [Ditylenchus destructor]|nr:BTB/POZ domain-containing protein [Ditylenchus destructor]
METDISQRDLATEIKAVYKAAEEDHKRFSAPVYIRGLPWKIMAFPETIDGKGQTLNFLIHCEGDSMDPTWQCLANVSFYILSQKENDFKPFTNGSNLNERFYCDQKQFGLTEASDILLNPVNGYIKDDTIILRVKVMAAFFVRDRPQQILRELSLSTSYLPDCVLIVENLRIPIHKTYLSFYSECFKTMFEGKFIETSEKEIVLEEVAYEEMLELLLVIYPSAAQITEFNVKAVLKLADRFIMPTVLERCKNMLKKSDGFNKAQKLLLAQRYNFRDLQKEFAQAFRTVEDVRNVKEKPEFKLLDDNIHLLIYRSIIDTTAPVATKRVNSSFHQAPLFGSTTSIPQVPWQ